MHISPMHLSCALCKCPATCLPQTECYIHHSYIPYQFKRLELEARLAREERERKEKDEKDFKEAS